MNKPIEEKLSVDDAAKLIGIDFSVKNLMLRIDSIGGYGFGDETRRGLDSRLVELHRYISSRLTKEDREKSKRMVYESIP